MDECKQYVAGFGAGLMRRVKNADRHMMWTLGHKHGTLTRVAVTAIVATVVADLMRPDPVQP